MNPVKKDLRGLKKKVNRLKALDKDIAVEKEKIAKLDIEDLELLGQLQRNKKARLDAVNVIEEKRGAKTEIMGEFEKELANVDINKYDD